MTMAQENIVWAFEGLSRLVGPIADKELRVLSRRRRTYVLRSCYLLLLLMFISGVWLSGTHIGGGSAVYQVSRMPEVGKSVATTILWFQFIAAQLIAVSMLSTAISDEVYKRTLVVLMTTPITSLQIVMGKLVSRLLQLMLLLAISFPLLAIVRVFGGVSWAYVFSSVCITMTAMIFAGSASLFFSIHTRRMTEVIAKTMVMCVVLYLLIPAGAKALSFAGTLNISDSTLICINPFAIMYFNTINVFNPSGASGVSSFLHCLIMLSGAAVMLGLSAILVRRAGLRQIAGNGAKFISWKEKPAAKGKVDPQHGSTEQTGNIRQLKGPAIIWKDMVIHLNKCRRLRTVIVGALAVVALLGIYIGLGVAGLLVTPQAQIGFVCGYLLLALVRVMSVSASCITYEKEAAAWPILLTTPLDNFRIIRSKIGGSILQGWIIWILLVGHIIIFTLAGCINPLAVIGLMMIIVCSAVMISTVGVYISSRSKRTSTAASVMSVLFFIFVTPFCCPMPSFLVSPLFLAGMILAAAGGLASVAQPMLWLNFSSGMSGFLIAALIFVGIMAGYLVVAFIFYSLAVSNVRKKVF
jgi:ABC-type transport system involved in multi-copper enzyme maturation permease subunit